MTRHQKVDVPNRVSYYYYQRGKNKIAFNFQFRNSKSTFKTTYFQNLNVTNFSTSWNDGMAFCALIHHYYPEAFNYEELDPKNRRYNFDLAFRAAE